MTKEFLKKQNIHLDNIWVCHDLDGNIISVDLEQLLEDYHEFKVKKLRLGDVSGSLRLDELAKEIGELSDEEFEERCKRFKKRNDS